MYINSSISAIKKAREIGLDCHIDTRSLIIPTEPHNLYIELIAQKNKQIYKIQQWNFKCLKTIVESQYESNNDSQLDSVQLQKKSYFTLLQQKLVKFNPKILIKTLEPKDLYFILSTSDKQLKPFYSQDIYLINIDEYEGNGFNCHVTLQTIQTEMNRKQKQQGISSSQQQFEVLHDSNYQKQKRTKQINPSIIKQISNSSNNTIKISSNIKIQMVQQVIKQQRKPVIQTKIEEQKKQKQPIISKIQYNTNNVNINISKYSTKQIAITQIQKKISLANDTVDLIRQLNLGGDTLREFLKKL